MDHPENAGLRKPCAKRRRLALIFSTLCAHGTLAHAGWPAEEVLDIRLFAGTLDGEENSTGLGRDSTRYTLGLGASSPVAMDGRLEANLEIWATERAYDNTLAVPPSGSVSGTMTFTAAALTYGLRLQPANARLRPYAMAGLGFQGSRLRATVTSSGIKHTAEEEIITPTAHVGAGVEWRFGEDFLGIDYRRWFTQGEFRDFGIDDSQLGGEFLGLSLGTRW